jgi:signal transduction histidine kinase
LRRLAACALATTVVLFGAAVAALRGHAQGVAIVVGLVVLLVELACGSRLLRRARRAATPSLPIRHTSRSLPAPIRSGRLVATAMLAVVISFSISLAYSQLRLRRIEDNALDILQNATPSVDHLSATRGELWRLGTYVNAYLSARADAQSRENISASRQRVKTEFAEYRALPTFPEERAEAVEAENDLALVDKSVERALAERDAGSAAGAARDNLHARLERTDDSLDRLQTLNSSYSRAGASSILEIRHTAKLLANTLGALSIVVAIVASVLVTRVLRARSRLMEEHDRLVAARATELEEFAGRVAHDLKNPLGAVALRLQASQRRFEMNPELRDGLDKMGRQVGRMAHIIDGLLEFARAGATPTPGAHANLGTVVQETEVELRPAAEAVGAELRVDAFGPVDVACTPGALSSVLSNLVGNAVKYVGEGSASERWIAVHVEDLEAVVRVEVEDNGPGLPPGAEKIVFEPFRRATDTKQPGIGLGLATVKKIVEAYRGRVGVDSTLGKGASFWFELPKARPTRLALD